MEMKYIVFMNGEVCVFPKTVSHSFMAGNKIVLSAGFCRIETYRNEYDDIRAKVQVWGDSVTLGVESNPDDANAISRMFI